MAHKHDGEVECAGCRRLLAENRLLKRQNSTDFLTGIPNRLSFDKKIKQAIHQSEVRREPLSMTILDIDFFKRINDKCGHDEGDRVLRELAHLINGRNRPSKVFAARVGGEEFMILFPNTTLNEAKLLADSFRILIYQKISVLIQDKEVEVTASFGVAELHDGEDFQDLIRRADKALYFAKNNGRNRVSCSHGHKLSLP